MKKLIFLSLSCLLLTMTGYSQKFNDLDKSPMDIAICRNKEKACQVRVIYSRPQKRGRQIFGKVVPYDKVWRTGANEATEITFYEPMKVSDVTVEPGTYSIFTIPGEKEWTVILNKATNVWGAYSYEDKEDIVRIKVPARKAAAPIEAFSMAFQPTDQGSDLFMGWDDVYVQVPFVNVES